MTAGELVVVLAAVLSNTASEMGYVVLIPLAAVVYHSVGRHPFVGLAAAFAGVSGGYSANLFIGTVDPLLAGITTEAARIVGGDAGGDVPGEQVRHAATVPCLGQISHPQGGHKGDDDGVTALLAQTGRRCDPHLH